MDVFKNKMHYNENGYKGKSHQNFKHHGCCGTGEYVFIARCENPIMPSTMINNRTTAKMHIIEMSQSDSSIIPALKHTLHINNDKDDIMDATTLKMCLHR